MSRAILRAKRHLLSSFNLRNAATTSSSTSAPQGGGRGQDRQSPPSGYVVLIPEIPPDTDETNPLLRTSDIPDFEAVTSVAWRNAVIKLCIELETAIWKTEEIVSAKASSVPTVQELSTPLDSASVPLHYVWSLLKTMSIVKSDVFRAEIYEKFHERATSATSKKYQSETLYRVWRDLEIPTASAVGSTSEARLVSKYVTEATLSGIRLTGNAKAEFIQTSNSLRQVCEHFDMNIQEATSRFKHLIIDPKYVGSMPHEGLLAISKSGTDTTAKRGPWTVKLSSPGYEYFMQYCPERALRWNTWQAYVSRASNTVDKVISNSIPIEEIRMKRASIAKLLGYETYADLSMVTKMAGNLDNVKTMIASLFVVANPKQSEEIASLQSYAESRGFDHKLKPWDIPYWRRKQLKSLYNLDHTVVETYFPYPVVVSRMISFASHVFGIHIQKENKKGWHEDVEFYSVSDSKRIIGHFFVDPYARPGQKLPGSSWMLGNRPKYDKLNLTPLSSLVFNFKPPMYGKPSLLSFSDISDLFEKFGEMLQHTLTTIQYPEISGTTNIEWDCTRVASEFMAMWLGNKAFLGSLSSHFESGEPLPDEMLTGVLKSLKHLAAFDLSHQLYLSDLDIEMYSTSEFWLDVTKRLWSLYKSSAGLLLDKADSHPCSFQQIFSGNYAAAYYSGLWSKMLAADIYRAFVSEGGEKERWKAEGSRFRNTFLSLGGGYHPSEVFRKFRGRDPSPDALLWALGLKTISESNELPEEKSSQLPGAKNLRSSSAN